MLVSGEDSMLWRRCKNLGNGIKKDKHHWLESSKSIAKVHQSCNEDDEVEDEGSDIAERHCK